MTNTQEPRIIARLRAVDSGAWDMGMADFSTAELHTARSWAIKNDGNLLILIEDELRFRDS